MLQYVIYAVYHITNVCVVFASQMKNRSRFEVIAAILKSVNGETRTRIIYKAMLSNDQCKVYLDYLIRSGLAAEVDEVGTTLYRITPKGMEFLSYYEQLEKLL